MKILQIISSKSIGGGSQEHTRLLSCGLAKKGHALTMICRHGTLVDAYRAAGLETIPLELRDRIKAVRFIIKLIKERGFDVVHTHNRDGDIAGLIAARMAHVPFVVSTLHAPINEGKFGNRKMNAPFWFYNKILKYLPHKIIVLSMDLQNHILKELNVDPDKLFCIMNSVDLTCLKGSGRKEEIGKELNIPENTVVIGGVGKMIFLKGYQYLIDSARQILQQFPNVKFILIGGGNQLGIFKEQVVKYGIDNNVTFLGPRNDVVDILPFFDILVHPSLSEGLPRAIMEAQGLGVPVVATRIGGVPEVVEDGQTGFIIPPRDPGRLTEAIITLIKDERKRKEMGEAGKKLIYEKFSHVRMVEETESFFLRSLSRK